MFFTSNRSNKRSAQHRNYWTWK